MPGDSAKNLLDSARSFVGHFVVDITPGEPVANIGPGHGGVAERLDVCHCLIYERGSIAGRTSHYRKTLGLAKMLSGNSCGRECQLQTAKLL